MQEKQTYYDVLGVARNATLDVIKIVYRKLSQKHHPDKNQGSESAESMMKVLNEAYSVLSDPVKRAAYDAEIDRAAGYSEPKQEAPPPPPPPPKQPPPRPASPPNRPSSTKNHTGAANYFVIVLAIIAVILTLSAVGIFSMVLVGNPSDQTQVAAIVPQRDVTKDSAYDEYNTGRKYFIGQGVPLDYVQAAQWFQMAADQGLAVSQFALGNMYLNGQGVQQDYSQALQWLQKAADQGFADAQFGLGDIYINGLGVQKDYVQAAQWFQKAADQGDAGAQFALGYMCANGVGVQKNADSAVYWLKKAANQGDADAEKLLAKINHGGGSTAATPPHHSHTYTNADLPRSRPSCEYKQVMTNDDLRACGINPSP